MRFPTHPSGRDSLCSIDVASSVGKANDIFDHNAAISLALKLRAFITIFTEHIDF